MQDRQIHVIFTESGSCAAGHVGACQGPPLSLQCPPSRQKGEQSPKRLVQSASGPPLPSYTPLLATPPLVPASSLFSPPRLHRWLGGKKLSLAGGLRRKRAKRWVSAHSRALGSHTLHKHSTPGSHVGPLLPPPDLGSCSRRSAPNCRPVQGPHSRSFQKISGQTDSDGTASTPQGTWASPQDPWPWNTHSFVHTQLTWTLLLQASSPEQDRP